MMTTLYHILFAQVYGSGAYSTAVYGNGQGSSLSNTGIAVAAIATAAAVILLVAIVVRVWRRPSKRAAEVVENDQR